MSVQDVIADVLENTHEGQSEWGHIGRAAQILDALRSAGYVVAKVPTPKPAPSNPFDDEAWKYADGWNACRAAMLASSEETP